MSWRGALGGPFPGAGIYDFRDIAAQAAFKEGLWVEEPPWWPSLESLRILNPRAMGRPPHILVYPTDNPLLNKLLILASNIAGVTPGLRKKLHMGRHIFTIYC